MTAAATAAERKAFAETPFPRVIIAPIDRQPIYLRCEIERAKGRENDPSYSFIIIPLLDLDIYDNLSLVSHAILYKRKYYYASLRVTTTPTPGRRRRLKENVVSLFGAVQVGTRVSRNI